MELSPGPLATSDHRLAWPWLRGALVAQGDRCCSPGPSGLCCARGQGTGVRVVPGDRAQGPKCSSFLLSVCPALSPGPPPPAGHGPTLKDGWWGWGLVRGRSTCPCPRLWGRGVWRTRPFPPLRRSEKTRGSVSLEGTGLTLVTPPAQPRPCCPLGPRPAGVSVLGPGVAAADRGAPLLASPGAQPHENLR